MINVDAKDNLVKIRGKGYNKKIVALIGVDNLCIIQDDDVFLVAKRGEVEKVKNVLKKVREKSLESFL